MERYQVTLGGQVFQVEILSDPRLPQVQVRVDGETLIVELAAVGGAVPAGLPAVLPTDQPTPITRAPADATGSQSAAAPSSNLLTAPLPGTIIQVQVKPGQRVSQGDELLVIEAMKMNNQIRAPRAGTIRAVLVETGQQVGHGAPLVRWAD